MSTLRETEEITMVDARRELTGLLERLEARPATVAVTRRGKPVLAIMTWEDYEAILETLEVLSDEEAMDQLRQSIREAREGNSVSWEEARTLLNA
ncbi:MAG: type II toxin-antitoxin system Phd/YefM family antitoxin [Dehalococcoidia bacterium]|nr:type II toxin-antitoxin system Phd/YefM family antitoxin [Dehalococcoidia bacterium]